MKSTKLPFGHLPLLLQDGEVTLQSLTGKLVTVTLSSHSYQEFIDELDNVSEADLRQGIQQATKLRRFGDAWLMASKLNHKEDWMELGTMALHSLNIDFGKRMISISSDAQGLFRVLFL